VIEYAATGPTCAPPAVVVEPKFTG
jgi:hypothetical protein